FNEASGLAQAVQKHYPGLKTAGDPARSLAEAIRSRSENDAPVALVHATAFTDDYQVMAYLARELGCLDIKSQLVSPEHLHWERGQAFISSNWYRGPAGFVFRFFPGEWLVELPRSCSWQSFFHYCTTPLTNPATALLTQSKRFPLVWNELK